MAAGRGRLSEGVPAPRPGTPGEAGDGERLTAGVPPTSGAKKVEAGTTAGPPVGDQATGRRRHTRRLLASADCTDGCDWLELRPCHPIRGQLLYTLWFRAQDGDEWSDWDQIHVYADCFDGLCTCKHYVGGVPTQLRPCRFIVKAFQCESPVPGWDYVLRGVLFGFKVMDASCQSEYKCANYEEATKGENYKLLTAKLRKELDKGCVTQVDSPMICTHAIGCVPKGDGVRGIVDCSRPAGSAVNNYTEGVAEKFKYKSVHTVCDMLTDGNWLCTVDISDAFRAVHTHPSSRLRQGLAWDFGEGEVYLRDNRLSMGLSSAPYCFTMLSDFTVHVLANAGASRCVSYLDDYCLVSDSQEQGRADQRLLVRILRHLGFDISFKKLTDPNTTTRFLGIDIDTVDMCLRLPADKLARLESTVSTFIGKISATKQELDELAGLLAHCSTVINGGNTFTRRVYDLCASETRPFVTIKLTEEFQDDMLWWEGFARFFNGSSKIRDPSTPMLGLYSDSSFWGYGAYSNYDWLAGPWDTANRWAEKLGNHYEGSTEVATDENINVLELFPILKAMHRWGPRWRNAKVCCVTDNTQVMWAIRKGRSKNKFSMKWLREIFWLSVQYNFTLCSVYIPTDDNVLCDSLSRLDLDESVSRIVQSMSSDSMCCYDLFSVGSASRCGVTETQDGVQGPPETLHLTGV